MPKYTSPPNPKLSGSGQPDLFIHGAYTWLRIWDHIYAIPVMQMYCWGVIWKALIIFPTLRMKSYGEPTRRV
jgi:hypothetical protein